MIVRNRLAPPYKSDQNTYLPTSDGQMGACVHWDGARWAIDLVCYRTGVIVTAPGRPSHQRAVADAAAALIGWDGHSAPGLLLAA